ncbi:MAG: hypothetical protein PCFJNLEI_00654 [Verrucomicrobiae bacterium]|nr:hypothetical protein [Verrucomicrobiae bacterium]
MTNNPMKDVFERRTNGRSKFSFVVVAAAVTLLFAPASSRADFSVANIFGDHMILQRGVAVPVWGRADPGSEITVRMAERTAAAKTGTDGLWRAELPAMDAGGPYEMTISGPASIVLKNVLVGDVWLCVGDAGMQKMAGQVPVATQILARQPASLRTSVPGTQSTSTSAPDLSRRTGWSMGTHVNSQYFSAIGIAFADELRERLEKKDLPIGLIQIAGPNTPIEAWVPRGSLTVNPETKLLVDAYDQAVASYRKATEALIPTYKQWRADMEKAEQTGSAWPQSPSLPPEPRSNNSKPCGYFNGVISPLASFPVKGVVWSHGETDVNRAGLYRQIFPMVIQSWRDAWKSPDLPFLFVQLGASGAKAGEAKETAWAALREAQKSAADLPKTSMVTILDVQGSDALLQIGRRLAEAALKTAYGKATQ